jgi:hypothetical protein
MTARSRAIIVVALSIATVACTTSEGPCGSGAACPGVGMYWASYQMNAEPHYRLIFEGGTEQMTLTELRIRDASGAIVASATVVPAEEEALRLCGGGIPKGGTGRDAGINLPARTLRSSAGDCARERERLPRIHQRRCQVQGRDPHRTDVDARDPDEPLPRPGVRAAQR